MSPFDAARSVFELCGADSPANLPLEDLISFYNGEVRDVELKNCDGRMVMKGGRAIVSVNKNIIYPSKRRFVLAHELGHMILHAGREAVFTDDEQTLEDYRKGTQEREANNFAAELLMPADHFKKSCFRMRFGSTALRSLAEKFNTSITATVFRFLDYGNHPICIVYSQNGVVKYWVKSEDFKLYTLDLRELPVPTDCVANEYYAKRKIYSRQYSDQEIFKSTWFYLNKFDLDSKMFEYCIISETNNSVISVIWEK